MSGTDCPLKAYDHLVISNSTNCVNSHAFLFLPLRMELATQGSRDVRMAFLPIEHAAWSSYCICKWINKCIIGLSREGCHSVCSSSTPTRESGPKK